VNDATVSGGTMRLQLADGMKKEIRFQTDFDVVKK